MIDTNVYLSRWPFRRLPLDQTELLAERLRQREVTQAWAGSFDGLMHRDLAAVNQRLTHECVAAGPGLLLPIGSVNPILPDWQDDLKRCHEQHGMRGIRLHPAWHGYELSHPQFEQLLILAAERRMIIQLVLSMEDDRTQHPVFRVPAVKTDGLAKILERVPAARLQILNGLRSLSLAQAAELAMAGKVWFDIAMLESVEGVAKLVSHVSADRVLFGSNSPLFYFESAELKLVESGLPESVLEEIRSGSATALLLAG